jgi:hypothetical protein
LRKRLKDRWEVPLRKQVGDVEVVVNAPPSQNGGYGRDEDPVV